MLVTVFYYVIDSLYIYSRKKINRILTHFGDATYQKYIFFGRIWCSPDNERPPPMKHRLHIIFALIYRIFLKQAKIDSLSCFKS